VCDETLEYVVDGDVAGCGDEHFPVEDIDRLMYEFGQGGRLPVDRMRWDGMGWKRGMRDVAAWFVLVWFVLFCFILYGLVCDVRLGL